MRGTIDTTFDGEDENNEDEAREVSDESDLSNASIDTVRETESEYATDCGGNGSTSDEDTLIEDD